MSDGYRLTMVRRCRLVLTYAALSFVVLSRWLQSNAQTVQPGLPLQGLDIAEDSTGSTLARMRADMSVNFMEAALLEVTISTNEDGEDDVDGVGCQKPGEGGCSWPTYSMTDVDGIVHVCTVRQETPDKDKKRGSSSSHRGKKSGVDISKALEPLNGKCATLTHDYWSYTWCHRGTIVQTHLHEDGSKTEINLGKHTRTEVKRVKPVADVESSAKVHGASGLDDKEVSGEGEGGGGGLGVTESSGGDGGDEANADDMTKTGGWIPFFIKAKMKEHKERKAREETIRKEIRRDENLYDGIDDFSQVLAVHDYYGGGDKCDETGGPRETRTSITCCASKLVGADAVATTPMALLVSIQEVSLCSYLVKVCSRLLCPSLADETGGKAGAIGGASEDGNALVPSKGVTAGSALDVLDALEACFPTKHESWWAYELCLSTGIRQFRKEQSRKPDGSVGAVVSAEFSLGKFDRSSVEGTGEELFRPGMEGEEGAIVLEFTGGTECDLTNELRSTTVYLKCGNMESISEVVEEYTCHYRLVAVSPLLCRHPALMPKLAPVRTVECVPKQGHKKKRGSYWPIS